MKILLTTLNSKYIHTALSLRYLKSYCQDTFENLEIQEYTINHQIDHVLGEIHKGKFQVVCFSCYIWNMNQTLNIARNLKKINPNLIVVVGGPEVSFDAVELMEQESALDYVICGEGEETFKELVGFFMHNEKTIENIKGIVYRNKEKIYKNEERALIDDLGKIPSPFTENLEEYDNKIIYYESSRGCPYNCRYCLSSTIKGVRFFPLKRVKEDLNIFLKNKVKQVKFVDRTFNVKKSHSLEIMKYLKENDNGITNFHFEITADLTDQETLDFLSTVREGLFQFEIGVQSTNDQTIKSVDRNVNFHKLSEVVKKVSDFKNIHLHLDLIAGLPYETYEIFKKSFDDVYNLRPEQLQLGFLKLLKGSGIRQDEALHGYAYKSEAPYEVLKNKYITYDELLKLKRVEEMVDHYYNSSQFKHSVEYIMCNLYKSAFDFYEDIAKYWEKIGYHQLSHGKQAFYNILLDFYREKGFEKVELFEEILKLDYLMQSKTSLPNFFTTTETGHIQQSIHEFLHDEDNINKYLPSYKGMQTKKIMKKVHFEVFNYDIIKSINNGYKVDLKPLKTIILFDYDKERKIFSKSNYHKVKLN